MVSKIWFGCYVCDSGLGLCFVELSVVVTISGVSCPETHCLAKPEESMVLNRTWSNLRSVEEGLGFIKIDRVYLLEAFLMTKFRFRVL